MTETKRAIASRANGARGGKPRRGKERRTTISIAIDTDVLSRLDTAAAGRSRSAIVEAALVAYLPPSPLIEVVSLQKEGNNNA